MVLLNNLVDILVLLNNLGDVLVLLNNLVDVLVLLNNFYQLLSQLFCYWLSLVNLQIQYENIWIIINNIFTRWQMTNMK